MNNKWLKMSLLAVPLIGAGYFLGVACNKVQQIYNLILSPSWDIIHLLILLFIAFSIVIIAATIVAVLYRPVWIGITAFAFSGLTMLIAMKFTMESIILFFVYLIATSIYTAGVAGELNQRLRFSIKSIVSWQRMLLLIMALMASGKLYSYCDMQVKKEGIYIPEFYMKIIDSHFDKQVESKVAGLPEENRQWVRTQLKGEYMRLVNDSYNRWIKPNAQYVPLLIAAYLFVILLLVSRLAVVVSYLVLYIVFYVLKRLRFTRIICEAQEVQRLVI